MQRLYYLADNLMHTVTIARELENKGINYEQMHVISKNTDGLVRHHIHSATPLEDHEIIKMGERGVIMGTIAGLIFVVALSIIDPFNIRLNVWILLAIWALFIAHGAWAGGLVGTHAKNLHVSRFEKEINDGKLLMLIDVTNDQKAVVHDVIDVNHPGQAQFKGETPAHGKPFEGLYFLKNKYFLKLNSFFKHK